MQSLIRLKKILIFQHGNFSSLPRKNNKTDCYSRGIYAQSEKVDKLTEDDRIVSLFPLLGLVFLLVFPYCAENNHKGGD